MYGVVLPAGGVGARMGGDRPKQFLEIQGRPIYRHALDIFVNHPLISEVVFVCAQEWLSHFEDEFQDLPVQVVVGGAERWNSVYNGLQAMSSEVQGVMVHDVARPFLPRVILDQCIQSLKDEQAFVVAKKAVDTIKRSQGNLVAETLDRNEIWLAQTPQGASRTLLIECFEKASAQGMVPTDEASVLEASSVPVHLIEGSAWNDKLTTPEDLARFKAWLQTES